MPLIVSAAARVTAINRRTSREQSHGIGPSAVVLQGTELGIRVVQIACAIKTATGVAAEVVTIRGYMAVTVAPSIVCDNAVPQHRRASLNVKDAAALTSAC